MKSVLLLGRGLSEYTDMFNLKDDELAGKRILDCAAGVSSFRSEMNRKGFDVTAVDPIYSRKPDELEALAEESFKRHRIFHGDFLSGIKVKGVPLEDYRRAVFRKFLSDYREDPAGYIAGELPHLPFSDLQFDLVLSANLLFLYEEKLSYRFHVEAVREMLRVGREVRIFPVTNIHRRRRSIYLQGIMDEFADHEILIQRVPYHEETGCNEMLIIKSIES
ncbi:hypothetical protein [Methanothermobacter sp. KEPCO 2]|uniref:Class I SAM-dependent methyltransferase n=1 Tax=Methanothermobacter thermautotrophicus TaxID=145262 RepID=A0A7J4MVT9_METTF|nr:class I SAM-dependent methyltransferase [Methanothermobacter thermautotrophicus]